MDDKGGKVEAESRFLTYKEAGVFTSLGRTKLTELVTSGSIPAARIGRRVLISKPGLETYLRNHRYVDAEQGRKNANPNDAIFDQPRSRWEK